jgi:Protein of unknown function (DUF2815)
MVDKVKIEPKIITIHRGRPSFLRTEATYRTDKFGREIKINAKTGKPVKPQWRMTWLLDPSDAQAAATIAEIKAESERQLDLFFNGRSNWPKDNEQTGTKGIIPCFGLGNKLPKVYDGYKDMFFIKVADSIEPIWGSRRGQSIRFDNSDGAWHVLNRETGMPTEEVIAPDQAPYSGCYARGRIALYVYNNEQAGVNANFKSVQFLETGPAFGGGGRRSAADELAEMAGDAPASTPAGTTGADPWD